MSRANGLEPIAFDGVGASPISLHYDPTDERYLLVTEIGGQEFSVGFVTCSIERGTIEFYDRRQLGEIAQTATLEGAPETFGEVGEQLANIDAGEHPEVATYV